MASVLTSRPVPSASMQSIMIDLHNIGEMLGTDDRTDVVDLAQLFADSFGEALVTMRAALARGDFEAVRFAAHRAKGAALTVGASSLATIVMAVEGDISCGRFDLPLGALLQDAERELLGLIAWLDGL